MQLSLTKGLILACALSTATWPVLSSAETEPSAAADEAATTPAAQPEGTSSTQPAVAAPSAAAPSAAAPAAADVQTGDQTAALPEGVTPEMMADGEELFFQNCRRCHGMRGKAGVPLAGNENIADPSYIAGMIINGAGYMPALGGHLDDDQIAAIATFARNSWGNAYGPVTPQDVQDMR
ncbi:c-type cytochrome [Paracoccus subflavus]|uniref:C-type cytochrome n=1 Tax=Paracoccus subflavus TaxID=2528244 RepID=A0A4Q9FXE7_9RHOB|nr:cytochrome c [Paracoccus subflavus]TBN38323.1 c-type cytochrome [Paracoccus subflavus]